MWRRSPRSQGFTLIEVLIALLIIAIALTASVQATNSSIRATTHVRQMMMAHWVGLNILSQIQTGLLPLPVSSSSQGQSQLLSQTFSWSAASVISPNLPKIARIKVQVSVDDHVLDTVIGYTNNAK